MNVSKFVVLGALEDLGACSGYDIDRYLHARMIHKWTDIKKASIYHALKSLARAGHAEVVEIQQNGAYPAKTLYKVTDTGHETFLKMQKEAAMGLFPKFYGFKLALKFNKHRDTADLEKLAQAAMARIDTILANMEAYLDTVDPDSPQHAFDDLFLEHDRQLYQAERAWIENAVKHYAAITNSKPTDR